MATRSSSSTGFVEKQLGKFPHFVMCMVLEWVLIIVLFLDGLLAFFTVEFAKYFELEIPCWLCARMNHVLAYKTPDFYYNSCICEAHKKDVSSLAFCHNHKKLSEIRKMCEGCLLSFATQKESDCDTYKSLVGVLNKNLECFIEDSQNIQLSLKDDGALQADKSTTQRCSCCGAPLKAKSNFSKGKNNSASFLQAPTASPRAQPFITSKNDESRDLESPRIPYTKSYFELPQNEDGNKAENQTIKLKEESKRASLPLLAGAKDINIESPKTPPFPWGNKFFGIPLTDSPNSSPRWSKKSLLEKTEFASDSNNNEGNLQDEADDAVLNNLKMQVHLDRKSLMALYMELDEERSASAVAANNAMAMITRLQEEKASLQMDASQYQRMMEEQIEYDEEVLAEEDFKAHGANSSPHGSIEGVDNVEKDLDLYQPVSLKADNGGGKLNDTLKDFRMEKTYLLGRMKKMENGTILAENEI